MKNLKQYISEKLVVNKDYDSYQYHPTTWEELKQIIEKRFEELGPGTKNKPINFNDIDVSKITTFHDETEYKGIFEETNFEYIDVSDWDVSNVKDMFNMFAYCHNLKSVGDLSNWDVSSVKDMQDMFADCEQLEYIGDLSEWKLKVSNVKDISGMFCKCKKLKSIGDISNWDVSSVEDMSGTFWDSGIKNIPSWYTK